MKVQAFAAKKVKGKLEQRHTKDFPSVTFNGWYLLSSDICQYVCLFTLNRTTPHQLPKTAHIIPVLFTYIFN